MVKLSGVEWKRFYTDPAVWGEKSFHDDEVITVDGVEIGSDYDTSKVPDSAAMTLAGGSFYDDGEYRQEAPSLESVFKKWRKACSTETWLVEMPKDKAEAIKAAIKAAGGKVV